MNDATSFLLVEVVTGDRSCLICSEDLEAFSFFWRMPRCFLVAWLSSIGRQAPYSPSTVCPSLEEVVTGWTFSKYRWKFFIAKVMRVAFHMESTRFLEKLRYQILISLRLNSYDGRNILIWKTYFDKTTGISKNLLLFRRNLLFSPRCFDFIFRFYYGNLIPFSVFSCTNITSLTNILKHGKEISTLVGLFRPAVFIS